jgi:hypothetical protein
VGKNSSSEWNLISETELNTQERQKALFSYRETMHPFTGLLYSILNDDKRFSNFHITAAHKIGGKIELLRLMGIKYIVSVNEKIDSPFLIFKGQYDIKESSFEYIHGIPFGGTIFIYEFDKPLGVAFLVDRYLKIDWEQSIKTIGRNDVFPWKNSEVYLEEDPQSSSQINISSSLGQHNSLHNEAKIIKEKFNQIIMDISSNSERYLVLSYIYRPNWTASIGSEKIKIYRAYGGFMCMKIPPGIYQIKLKYFPVDLYIGLALTFFSFALPVFHTIKKRKFIRLRKDR